MAFEKHQASGTSLETQLGKIQLVQLVGKGKSGYSYLARSASLNCIAKLMHDEPCPYYSFGDSNKADIEVKAYYFLKDLGISLPKLLAFDLEKKFIIKEYINGIVATELIAGGCQEQVIKQLYEMSAVAKNAHINLDFFPANFVIKEGILYYIDYEFNPYMEEWNLENWGIYYWANKEGMRRYLATGDITAINQSVDSGIPIKRSLEAVVSAWNSQFG